MTRTDAPPNAGLRRALALAASLGTLAGLAAFAFFAFGAGAIRPDEYGFALLTLAPFPLAWAVVRRFVRSRAALRLAVAAFTAMLLVSAAVYATVVRDYLGNRDPMASNIVVLGPVLQIGAFVVVALILALVEWRARAKAAAAAPL